MGDLRVLIAEDEPLDAELVVRELRKGGYDPQWTRVETAADFVRALAENPPELIISDPAMPQFGSAAALECLHDSGRAIPLIVVSQAIGEEEAVQLIRNGAADFLMKDRLGRLGEAVRQALEQQRLREAHAADQQAIAALNRELEGRVAERTAELQATARALEAELDQRKRAEQALQRLNAELEQRVEQRTRDVVASHHRLRALASELTLAEQRERKRLAADMHDYLAQMLALGRMKIAQLRPQLALADQAVGGMVREIDDLFKNSLAYTRSLMAKLSPPVLDELGLPAALKWLADQMSLQGLTVEVRSHMDSVPLPDDQAVLLFQSVRELLLNVSKHAATDRAAVTLRLDEQGRFHIDVQDDGRGFDLGALESRPNGEHFGLFSVRERMEDMGGWLGVRSAVGQGTTVTLSLPLGATAGPGVTYPGVSPADSSSPAGDEPGLRPVRVLLVENHTLVRQGLRALLDGYPDVCVIGEAVDGEEGIAMAAQHAPHLVLMGITMPWMDGIEATKRMKSEWPEIAVIGLSLDHSPDELDRMSAAGAAAVLSKDLSAEQLYQVILSAQGGAVPTELVRQTRLF